jgi:hypothetical protein
MTEKNKNTIYGHLNLKQQTISHGQKQHLTFKLAQALLSFLNKTVIRLNISFRFILMEQGDELFTIII